MIDRQLLKKILVILAIIVIGFIIISWIFNLLTKGSLTVSTTPEDAQVGIEKLEGSIESNTIVKTTSGKGGATYKLSPGTYRVLAISGPFTTQRVVTIKARESQKISMSVSVAVSPEPVYGTNTTSLIAGKSQLLFVDVATGLLSKIDAQNKVIPIDNTHILKSVKWANSDLGVALGFGNELYQVNKGVLTLVTPPFPINNSSKVIYDVSPNGDLYISNGQDVYAGPVGENLDKIYSSGDNYNTAISAGDDSAALIENDSSSDKPSLVVVNSDGKVEHKEAGVKFAKWSPESNKLLTVKGAGAVVMSQSYAVESEISANDLSVYNWGDDHTVFYSSGSQLYVHDTNLKQSNKIAEAPGAQSIIEIYQSEESPYLYFTAKKSNPDGGIDVNQLFRVGLDGQKVDDALLGLSVFLPDLLGGCFVNYVVFTQPNIVVTPPIGSTGPSRCQKYVEGALTVDGFDLKKLQITYLPS